MAQWWDGSAGKPRKPPGWLGNLPMKSSVGLFVGQKNVVVNNKV
jgi:hypothetical protein